MTWAVYRWTDCGQSEFVNFIEADLGHEYDGIGTGMFVQPVVVCKEGDDGKVRPLTDMELQALCQ